MLRIVLALVMLGTEPLSKLFFLCYSICGLSDAVDGTIARKTHSAGHTGAMLDSIADAVFMVVTIIKLAKPLINELNIYIYLIAALVFVIRIISYVVGAKKFGKYTSLHTILNKLTGLAIFCVPYIMLLNNATYFYIAIGILALVSACEEFMIQVMSKEFNPDIKSIFFRK